MSVQEQEQTKEKYHSEAMRYMDNAKEYLKNAQKEDGFYLDKKYVKTACGTAYNGVLVALDGFLTLKDIKPKGIYIKQEFKMFVVRHDYVPFNFLSWITYDSIYAK